MSEVQATVRDAGTLVRDDGRLLSFWPEAVDPGLRGPHPGQRVRVRLDGDRVVAVTLVGLPFT